MICLHFKANIHLTQAINSRLKDKCLNHWNEKERIFVINYNFLSLHSSIYLSTYLLIPTYLLITFSRFSHSLHLLLTPTSIWPLPSLLLAALSYRWSGWDHFALAFTGVKAMICPLLEVYMSLCSLIYMYCLKCIIKYINVYIMCSGVGMWIIVPELITVWYHCDHVHGSEWVTKCTFPTPTLLNDWTIFSFCFV